MRRATIRRRVCRHCPFRTNCPDPSLRSVLDDYDPRGHHVDLNGWACHSEIAADPYGTGGALCRGAAIASGAIPSAGEPACSLPSKGAS